MIYVNFKPVLSGSTFNNRVVLTDDAYGEMSEVYMNRADAPEEQEIVYLLITGNDGQPLLRKWMYVNHVLFPEYVDPIQRDENGDPILDNQGEPLRNSLSSSPGYCVVVLQEHKHVFTRSTFLDHFNMPSYLSIYLRQLGQLLNYNMLNELDWSGIRNLWKHRGIQLATPQEPPFIPVNLYYKGLHLADGLDDLAYHLSCRLVDYPTFIPANRKQLRNLPEVYSQINLMRRRFVDLPTNILYTKCFIPEQSSITREQDKESVRVAFSNITNYAAYFGGQTSAIANQSVSPNGVLACDKVFNGIDGTIPREWIQESTINSQLFYCFETVELPESFILSYDWSKIIYEETNGQFKTIVSHHPRTFGRMVPPHILIRTENFSGRVTSHSPGSITLTDLTTTNFALSELLTDSYTLPISDGELSTADIIGKRLNFQIQNNTVTLLSKSSLFEPLDDSVELSPLHNGNTVTQIVHEIENLNYACLPDAITFNSNPVFDYEFDSFEINPAYEGPQNAMVYNVSNTTPFNVTAANPNEVLNTCRVSFKMIATRQEIIEYLEDNLPIGKFGPDFIEALADTWILNNHKVDFLVTFSLQASRLEWRAYLNSDFTPVSIIQGFKSNINPDIDSFLFTGYRGASKGESQEFPLVFTDPNIRKTTPYMYVALNGSTIGFDNRELQRELAERYISNHLETYTASISLVYDT